MVGIWNIIPTLQLDVYSTSTPSQPEYTSPPVYRPPNPADVITVTETLTDGKTVTKTCYVTVADGKTVTLTVPAQTVTKTVPDTQVETVTHVITESGAVETITKTIDNVVTEFLVTKVPVTEVQVSHATARQELFSRVSYVRSVPASGTKPPAPPPNTIDSKGVVQGQGTVSASTSAPTSTFGTSTSGQADPTSPSSRSVPPSPPISPPPVVYASHDCAHTPLPHHLQPAFGPCQPTLVSTFTPPHILNSRWETPICNAINDADDAKLLCNGAPRQDPTNRSVMAILLATINSLSLQVSALQASLSSTNATVQQLAENGNHIENAVLRLSTQNNPLPRHPTPPQQQQQQQQ
ncbi:hypothetical protein L211DRAFT_853038 [Terfezia boudieri ATCC MYA-4762]|uniref:Uncharacterized protein n=1 Tax=Terfezia boudieri ATCC MYA-4762 TaxID=1051890 RepID=A0A3N4L9T4_9PEZI|nr:hypothetical protein L211DRAFT_853038 [Terfezia boudieri ATCC MYA-4762]